MRSCLLGGALIVAVLIPAPGPTIAMPTGPDSSNVPPPYLELGKPAAPESGEAIVKFRAGMTALGKGDLDAAADDFRAAAQAAPKAPGPHIGLAEVALRRGESSVAEGELKNALELAPNNAFAHSAWAHYLVTKKDYVAALAELDKAAALDPHWPAPHDQQGDIYLSALREPEKAVADYRAALAIDPKDTGARYGLGNALLAIGKPDDAKAELIEVTKLAPNNPWGWTALGITEARLGAHEQALADFDAALKITPTFVAAEIGRGDVLAADGKTDDAITAYQEALKGDEHSVPALVRLATEEDVAQRPADAERDYRNALAIDPQQPIAANNLAFLLADEKRMLDEALDLAKKAVQLTSNSPTTLDTLAWVHRARGELPAAVEILQPLAETATSPTPLYHLGVVYAEMGKPQDAISAFDRALKIAPNFQPARDARQKLAGAK